MENNDDYNISNMFDALENETLNNLYLLYKNVYPQYINHEEGPYVYGCVENWIIVFEKLRDTKTNEIRNNIICDRYAEYIANKLKVILIFDKFDPHTTTLKYVSVPETCSIVTYQQGKIFEKRNFRLSYYKSIFVPYFFEIANSKNNDSDGYTGFYVGWYDTGFVSEKGNYIFGEKSGIWKYGSIIKKTKKICDDDFICIEYENGNVKKSNNIVNNTTDHVQKFISQTSSYVEIISDIIFTAIKYTNPYIPTYISKYWN